MGSSNVLADIKLKGLQMKFEIFKKRSRFEYLFYTAVIAVGIILDQLAKYLAVVFLKPIESVPIIKDVLHLNYHENRGAAFGMLSEDRWIFITLSIIVILALGAYLYLGHAQNKLYAVSFSLILSGGIGNMIDRLALGYVVDFIDFVLIDFAIFNIADSFVSVGAGLMILAILIDLIKEIKEKKDTKEG